MKKFRNFLQQTSEITNKDRLIIEVCTLGLLGMLYWRDYAANKAEMENIDLEIKLVNMKRKLREQGFSEEDIKVLERDC